MVVLKKGELSRKVPKYAIPGYLANGWTYAEPEQDSGASVAAAVAAELAAANAEIERLTAENAALALAAENAKLKAKK